MKPRCPRCGSCLILAQSTVYVDRMVVTIKDTSYPELGAAYTRWGTEQAAKPQFLCGNCGYESNDAENFLEGG